MPTFSNLFTNFMLIGLMIVSILAFGIGLQLDNDVENSFGDEPLISEVFTDLSEDLGGFRDKSQSQKDLFESENPTTGFGSILLFSIVSSGKVFNSMVVSVFNSLVKLPVVYLGLDPMVVSVLTALLIFTIIVGLWVLFKLGS